MSSPVPVPTPPYRRLRGYAFDPSLSTQLDNAVVNNAVFNVAWEHPMSVEGFRDLDTASGLGPGPVGEYIEVVDYDPASGLFYEPVDLNDPLILAQDGLPPSEGNPQFHQQMTYAVAMITIKNFERALGRLAFWSPYRDESRRSQEQETFVRRLRIYPHAMREANAYYSPHKKALLFGYFQAADDGEGPHFPGGTVFTCLSHDIVAHETTHALLDGMHRRYIEPTHPDTLAFHEAFADIVALFQHFTFPEVLRHQIAKTRGDLAGQSHLGELAQEFGKAIGHYGALRSAIGQVNPKTGQWEPLKPDPELYQTVMEPHDRGSILVAAIFDAFLTIYRSRVVDLFRIATNGTGALPAGAIHPDLVNRLAEEAAKSAQHVLTICIRALDYCPPVGITFDQYLRAIITADTDLVSDDDLSYRIGFIEAFRRRGIYPRNIRTLSMDSLCWERVSDADARCFNELAVWLRDELHATEYAGSRAEIFRQNHDLRRKFHRYVEATLEKPEMIEMIERVTKLVLKPDKKFCGKADRIELNADSTYHTFEVHAIRRARRSSPDGDVLDQAIVIITQQRSVNHDGSRISPKGKEVFRYRGGCTLILDLRDACLRYAISKDISDDHRLERTFRFQHNALAQSLRATYFGSFRNGENQEPFALLHRML